MNECKLTEIPNTKPPIRTVLVGAWGGGGEAVKLIHLYVTGGGGKWNCFFKSVSTGQCFC